MSNRWDVFDIALIGTSLSSFVGGWEGNFRSRLQATKQRPIVTYNFGVPGASSAGGVNSVAPCASVKPRAALIEYAMNDAQTGSGISVATFTTNLRSIISAYRVQNPGGSSIFLMTMNPAIGPAAANAPQLASYYQAVRDVSAIEAVGLIDAYPAWLAISPTLADIPDGIHPIPAKTQQVLVPLILSAISPLIV